jgi:hypothetical protein
MAVNQQGVRPAAQEVTEEMDVTVVVQQVVVVLPATEEMHRTERVGLHLPTEVTEATTDPMQYVLVDLVVGVVPTVTPVVVAAAAATLAVREVTIQGLLVPEVEAVHITMEPIKLMSVEYESVMAL